MNRSDVRPYFVALTLVLTALAVSCGDDGPSKPHPTTLRVTASADPTSGSAPLAVAFQAACSGGTSPFTFTWAFGDGGASSSQNPSHTYDATGTFEAIIIAHDAATPGQTAADTVFVEVIAGMTCSADAAPSSGVAPLSVSFEGSAAGGTPPYTYAWAFGDGGTSDDQNPAHVYVDAGAYDAVLTVHDAANPQAVAADTVHVTVATGLTCQASCDPGSGSAPLAVVFQATASGGTAPYTYGWTFGDGGTSAGQNPAHEYLAAGSYTAVLTVEDSGTPPQVCESSTPVTVAAGLSCTAAADPAAGLFPLEVSFTASASGGAAPYTYSWAFGDGGTSTEQNPVRTYASAGTYDAVLTVLDSSSPQHTCHDTVRVTATLPIECAATADPAWGVVPLSVGFVASVSGGALPYSYAWDFGDGSTSVEQNPTHLFEDAGTYQAILTAQDGASPSQTCSDTVVVLAIGTLECQASGNPASGAAPLTVDFQAVVSGGLPPYVHIWTFGDGGDAMQQNPSHVYGAPGTYTATLTVQDSGTPQQICESTVPVTVSSVLTCTSTATPSEGTAPLDVDFTSAGAGGTPPYSYAWTFGDGGASADQNPAHTYAAAGSFDAVVTVLDSGTPQQSASDTSAVTVRGSLTCSAAADPLTAEAPIVVSFDAAVSGGTPPYSYSWDFDDGSGSTDEDPSHTYATPGTYDASLVVVDASTPAQTCEATGLQITVTGPVFSILDAWWSFPLDSDGDDCRESAVLEWDPNVSSGTFSVVGWVYSRPEGSEDWTLRGTAECMTISGHAAEAQGIDLTGTGACQSHEFKIDLYQCGESSLLATRGPSDDPELDDEHWEEPATIMIENDVSWTDVVDSDFDGCRESARLHWSTRVSSGAVSVFANVMRRPEGSSDWTVAATTGCYPIQEDWTEFATVIDGAAACAAYDFRIEIVRCGQSTPVVTLEPLDEVDLDDENWEGTQTFSIADAWWTALLDNDTDGCYESGILHWNANVDTGDASIFAKVFWREEGTSTWILVDDTPCYTITGSVLDDRSVQVTASGSCTAYEFKIELMQCGGTAVLASRLPADDADMDDRDFGPTQQYTVTNAWWTDIVDDDSDNCRNQAALHWNADVSTGSAVIEAKVSMREEGAGTWHLVQSSGCYTINGTIPDDHFVTIDGTGSCQSREFKIEIVTCPDGTPVAERGPVDDVDLDNEDWESAQTFSFGEFWWTDVVDDDVDACRNAARLHWDVNVDTGTAPVLAKVFSRVEGTSTWNQLGVSSCYTISGATSEDTWLDITGSGGCQNYEYKVEIFRCSGTSPVVTRLPEDDADLDGQSWEGPQTFTVWNAWWTDVVDEDGDGCKSQGRLHWDIDVNSGSASISVQVFIRPEGATSWPMSPFYESSCYTITGNDVEDHWVSLTGSSTCHGYEFMISVLRCGQVASVATRGPAEDTDLNNQTWEEPPAYTIFNAWWTNQVNGDGDACIESARLHWDADVAYGSRNVKAGVFVKDAGASEWIYIEETACYWIYGSAADDQWIQITGGGPCDAYDFKIELYPCAGGALLTEEGPAGDVDLNDESWEWPPLAASGDEPGPPRMTGEGSTAVSGAEGTAKQASAGLAKETPASATPRMPSVIEQGSSPATRGEGKPAASSSGLSASGQGTSARLAK